MSTIEHLSYTQLNMYLRCPRQYYYRYIENKIYPPKARLSQGLAFHKTEADGFSKKMGYRRGYKISDLQLLYAEYFDDEIEKTEPIFDEGETRGKLLDEGVKAVEVYGKSKGRYIYPKQVEMPFEITFSNAPFTFEGRIDLIDVKDRLIDLKLRSRKFSQKEIETDLQLTSYYVGFREIFGYDPVELGWDLTLIQKEIKYERILVQRNTIHVRHFLQLIADISTAIKTGLFYPNTHSFLCSPDYCGYWNICMKGGKD